MAAGQAAQSGAETILFEKMKRPGLKLAITGKGRCNITNIAEINDFINHFGKTGRFLRQAFSRFFSPELISFFKNLNLELVTERGGRVFPANNKAPAVLRELLKWAKNSGTLVKSSSAVDKLIIDKGHVQGVVSHGKKVLCDAVILATGGASYPDTGSTGDGYPLAESAGHSIVPIRPALVPLEIPGNISEKLAGLSLRNINVGMFINRKKQSKTFGEIEFSEFGLTGPVILTLSGSIVDAFLDGHKVELSIDLKPALDENKLDARLLRDISTRRKETFNIFLRGLLPLQMIPVCMDLTGIPSDLIVAGMTAKQRRCLRTWLKDFRLEISGHRPFSEAIITAGGVDTREINPRTMESLKTKGLFIAGELLDIQADTGGYNLQAAFSTGWLAGRSAAETD